MILEESNEYKYVGICEHVSLCELSSKKVEWRTARQAEEEEERSVSFGAKRRDCPFLVRNAAF